MATYTTRVTVGDDRRVTVELPEDMPLGEADVTVSVEDDEGPEISGTGEQLLSWMRNRPPMPSGYTPRTRQQVDDDLRAMRDEWDR